MSTKFDGFGSGKENPIRVHGRFFSELLPLIDDLAELKLILYCYHALHQIEGDYRYLHYSDFRDSGLLMGMLGDVYPEMDPDDLLDQTLENVLKRGALLHVEVELEAGPEALYFLNTDIGREAIAQLNAGQWRPDRTRAIEILPPRPNAYALYEANIGPLTPRIKDEIQDAEKEFSAPWVEEAILKAVEYNKRNWAYIRGILTRWKQEGKHDEGLPRASLEDGKRYVSGKYADFIDS